MVMILVKIHEGQAMATGKQGISFVISMIPIQETQLTFSNLQVYIWKVQPATTGLQ